MFLKPSGLGSKNVLKTLFIALMLLTTPIAQAGVVNPLGFNQSSALLPLRVASVQNKIANSSQTMSSFTNLIDREPEVLGQDMRTLTAMFYNWYDSGGEQNTGNAVTILKVSIETNTGLSIPLYKNGSRSYTMASGENNVVFDTVSAAANGLTVFPRGAVYWLRYELQTSGSANTISNYIPTADYSGSQSIFYLPANTTITNGVDGTGLVTYSGTTPAVDNKLSGVPMLLGNPSSDSISVFGLGDSTMVLGTESGNAQGPYGIGFFQHSMHDASGFTNPRPINVARSGTTAAFFTGTNTKWQVLAKYCNAAIVGIGTNDIGNSGTANVATIETNIQTIVAGLQANGITSNRLMFFKLGPRTTSTGSVWNQDSDQTYVAGWAVADYSSQLNSWVDTKVSDGTFIYAFPRVNIRSTTDALKWRGNGSGGPANLMTLDGLHQDAYGNEQDAIEVRAFLSGL
ncbi:hypothetical protein [Rhodopila sp.]|uniref:hypothetical protein n=1 Tax=Rhodopila sp. TaxID=2480087 RepID=UPI003D0B16E2